VKNARALVLTGYGINCDYETQFALKNAGFEAERVHINDVVSKKVLLEDFHLFAFPGGFSYGDDLGAGKAMAVKIIYSRINNSSFKEKMQKFIDDGKLVVGICNGFQIMVKLGLLPAFDKNYFVQDVTLMGNASGRFEDRWIYLKGKSFSKCVFSKGIEKIYLPVRHGEGNFIPRDKKVLNRLKDQGQIVFQYADENYNVTDKYPFNPNGAVESIAGICDETGRVFGMMPHPEAHLFFENHPRWTRIKEALEREGKETPKEGEGAAVWRNAFNYAKDNLL